MFNKRLVIVAVLGSSACTGSPISPVGGAHNSTRDTAPTSLSISYASRSGTTLVAVCALGNTSSSISSISDKGSTWAFRAGVNNGTAVRSEIWSTNAGGSVASTSFTVTVAGGTPTSCALEEYAGVQSLGVTSTNQTTSGAPAVSLTTEDKNDYIVAGLGANSYNAQTVTNGKIRQIGGVTETPGTDFVEMDLCDNTVALMTSVTCSSAFGPSPWAAAALELRSAGGPRQ
jgi:hypothetical protein